MCTEYPQQTDFNILNKQDASQIHYDTTLPTCITS